MLGSTRNPRPPRGTGRARTTHGYQPRKRPRQARARATYDSIVEAAARLLEQRGYAALTTNHVADSAGVAIGSLYEYFPTKEVIVAEVVRRTLSEVAAEIATELGHALAEGLEGSLPRLVHAMFQAVSSRRGLMRVLWMDVPFLMELEEVQALPARMYAIAKPPEPECVEGSARLQDPDASTYLLTVMVRAAVMESVVMRPESIGQARLERALVDMLAQLMLGSATGARAVASGADAR